MKVLRRASAIKQHLASPRFSSTATRALGYDEGMAANMMGQKFDISTKYKMNSGYEIPVLGYGVCLQSQHAPCALLC